MITITLLQFVKACRGSYNACDNSDCHATYMNDLKKGLAHE